MGSGYGDTRLEIHL